MSLPEIAQSGRTVIESNFDGQIFRWGDNLQNDNTTKDTSTTSNLAYTGTQNKW